MDFQIRAKGIFLTDAMKDRIVQTLGKLEKFSKIIAEKDVIHVEVKHYKENMSRITAFIETTKQAGIFKTDLYNADFYVVLRQTKKDLERQITRAKEMKVDTKRHRTKPGPDLVKITDLEDDSEDND